MKLTEATALLVLAVVVTATGCPATGRSPVLLEDTSLPQDESGAHDNSEPLQRADVGRAMPDFEGEWSLRLEDSAARVPDEIGPTDGLNLAGDVLPGYDWGEDSGLDVVTPDGSVADDSGGNDCGSCACGEICVEGNCIFVACGAKECGDDGCGGSCGEESPCQVANEWGTCGGNLVCDDGQWVDCEAPTPGPEICDGKDNDCDGDIDEDGNYEHLCNDDNDCTTEFCDGEDGCSYLVLNGPECKDGDPCTVADHCEEGICVGQSVNCDDGNQCTKDTCDGLVGCAFAPVWGECDDGDPCTLGDHCTNMIECVGDPIPGCT